jgi:hypothetical protein
MLLEPQRHGPSSPPPNLVRRYAGLEKLVRVVPVTRPPLPHEKQARPRLAVQACPLRARPDGVWWTERDGTVDILVGHDDVTWDFGVTVPLSTVHNLLAEPGEPPEAVPAPFGPTLF